jgi:hypothetical protein
MLSEDAQRQTISRASRARLRADEGCCCLWLRSGKASTTGNMLEQPVNMAGAVVRNGEWL